MAFTMETSAKIQLWRQKALEGTLTPEEQREVIEALRQDRIGASITGAKSRTAKATAKAPVDTKGLLDGLMGGNKL